MLSSGAQTPSNKPHYIERVIVMAVAMMLGLRTIVMVLSLKFTIRQQSSFMVHGHGTLDGGHRHQHHHHHHHYDHYIEEIEIQPLFTLLHSQEEMPYIYLE